ncbi:hypothetical protein LTR37_009357 [Vermiconidia calcicola]|uniref:Uncharacterized protein n=1 Tax=Vermiconidia calcicola TaxID=1690605 RepID=A0ACC3N7V7_9PEZI|nr:hypothetical protein LTR37_009357 [Vermiconidia calcicola]
MHRAFDDDVRRQRTFVFNFEYYTLIGKDCQPMTWQLAAGQEDRKPGYIQITRCSAVVALALNGPKIKDIKNPSRRRRNEKGSVYDPFSSWQVLDLQCCPDFKASLDVHDSTKHYINGPEAFMNTLLGEFRDAHRRLSDITKRISRRVRPPLEFMFDSTIRDRLLFEDNEYSMSRQYFWSHQTLGIINESIKAMIEAYEDNFTDDVWEGRHKSLWPLLDENSQRNNYYRKKMAALKAEFDLVLLNLRKLLDENNDRRKEIQDLREDLFTGTSIQESRKSVMATETTVQQGHNIKLLTMVSIFFLPLTFVTSVFGMTNMPENGHYWMFAIVSSTVCVPFFILIGSLNSRRGLQFWKRRTKAAFHSASAFCKWVARSRRNLDSSRSDTLRTNTLPLRRRSSTISNQKERKVMQADLVAEEPRSREEGQERQLENGRLSIVSTMSATLRPTFAPETTRNSRLANMWIEERDRRRRLRYSQDA